MDTKTDAHILNIIHATQLQSPLAAIVRKPQKELVVVKAKPPPPVVKKRRGRPRKIIAEPPPMVPPPKPRSEPSMAEQIAVIRQLEIRIIEERIALINRQLGILYRSEHDRTPISRTVDDEEPPARVVLSQQQIARVRR